MCTQICPVDLTCSSRSITKEHLIWTQHPSVRPFVRQRLNCSSAFSRNSSQEFFTETFRVSWKSALWYSRFDFSQLLPMIYIFLTDLVEILLRQSRLDSVEQSRVSRTSVQWKSHFALRGANEIVPHFRHFSSDIGGISQQAAFCFVLLTKYNSGYEIKKNGCGRACSTYGGEERCLQGFNGEMWGKETTRKTQS